MGRPKKITSVTDLFNPPNGNSSPGDDETKSELDAMKASSTLNCVGQSNCYFKIYRQQTAIEGGKLEFCQEISDASSVDDIEVFLQNLALSNGWPGGVYSVALCQKTTRGPEVVEAQKYNITIPMQSQKSAFQSAPIEVKSLREQITDTAELMKILRESANGNGEKGVSEAFQKGVELAKTVYRDTTGSGSKVVATPTSELSEILRTLKELNILRSDPPSVPVSPVTPQMTLLSTLNILRDLGLLPNPEEKLRERDNNPLSAVATVSELVNAVRPLIPSVDGGSSIGVELIRSIGPSLPGIVASVTESIREIASVQRAKFMATSNPTAIAPLTSPMPPVAEGIKNSVNEKDKNIVKSEMSGRSALHPIITEILTAVQVQDVNFFPRLEALIIAFVGEPTLHCLLNEEISVNDFLLQLSENLKIPELCSVQAMHYLKVFIDDHLTSIKCNKCGVVFDILKTEWAEMTSRACTECDSGVMEQFTVSENVPSH